APPAVVGTRSVRCAALRRCLLRTRCHRLLLTAPTNKWPRSTPSSKPAGWRDRKMQDQIDTCRIISLKTCPAVCPQVSSELQSERQRRTAAALDAGKPQEFEALRMRQERQAAAVALREARADAQQQRVLTDCTLRRLEALRTRCAQLEERRLPAGEEPERLKRIIVKMLQEIRRLRAASGGAAVNRRAGCKSAECAAHPSFGGGATRRARAEGQAAAAAAGRQRRALLSRRPTGSRCSSVRLNRCRDGGSSPHPASAAARPANARTAGLSQQLQKGSKNSAQQPSRCQQNGAAAATAKRSARVASAASDSKKPLALHRFLPLPSALLSPPPPVARAGRQQAGGWQSSLGVAGTAPAAGAQDLLDWCAGLPDRSSTSSCRGAGQSGVAHEQVARRSILVRLPDAPPPDAIDLETASRQVVDWLVRVWKRPPGHSAHRGGQSLTRQPLAAQRRRHRAQLAGHRLPLPAKSSGPTSCGGWTSFPGNGRLRQDVHQSVPLRSPGLWAPPLAPPPPRQPPAAAKRAQGGSASSRRPATAAASRRLGHHADCRRGPSAEKARQAKQQAWLTAGCPPCLHFCLSASPQRSLPAGRCLPAAPTLCAQLSLPVSTAPPLSQACIDLGWGGGGCTGSVTPPFRSHRQGVWNLSALALPVLNSHATEGGADPVGNFGANQSQPRLHQHQPAAPAMNCHHPAIQHSASPLCHHEASAEAAVAAAAAAAAAAASSLWEPQLPAPVISAATGAGRRSRWDWRQRRWRWRQRWRRGALPVPGRAAAGPGPLAMAPGLLAQTYPLHLLQPQQGATAGGGAAHWQHLPLGAAGGGGAAAAAAAAASGLFGDVLGEQQAAAAAAAAAASCQQLCLMPGFDSMDAELEGPALLALPQLVKWYSEKPPFVLDGRVACLYKMREIDRRLHSMVAVRRCRVQHHPGGVLGAQAGGRAGQWQLAGSGRRIGTCRDLGLADLGSAGSGTAGSDADLGLRGSGTAGSGTAATGTAGSGTAGSWDSGSGTAGIWTADLGSAGLRDCRDLREDCADLVDCGILTADCADLGLRRSGLRDLGLRDLGLGLRDLAIWAGDLGLRDLGMLWRDLGTAGSGTLRESGTDLDCGSEMTAGSGTAGLTRICGIWDCGDFWAGSGTAGSGTAGSGTAGSGCGSGTAGSGLADLGLRDLGLRDLGLGGIWDCGIWADCGTADLGLRIWETDLGSGLAAGSAGLAGLWTLGLGTLGFCGTADSAGSGTAGSGTAGTAGSAGIWDWDLGLRRSGPPGMRDLGLRDLGLRDPGTAGSADLGLRDLGLRIWDCGDLGLRGSGSCGKLGTADLGLRDLDCGLGLADRRDLSADLGTAGSGCWNWTACCGSDLFRDIYHHIYFRDRSDAQLYLDSAQRVGALGSVLVATRRPTQQAQRVHHLAARTYLLESRNALVPVHPPSFFCRLRRQGRPSGAGSRDRPDKRSAQVEFHAAARTLRASSSTVPPAHMDANARPGRLREARSR
uniref:ANK_REP_REGION domain-containing protein n=1 Tax=Macrostomum lignano TaxID=282301 RepID=A0A1I8JRR0_9PLAT